jgi:hypothetical protein
MTHHALRITVSSNKLLESGIVKLETDPLPAKVRG